MKQKHFFASANTGFGFDMRFNQINTGAGFTYVVKGGSGTGKSTMMAKIGNHFLKKGHDVEFVHCSTDTKSLDGVRICEANILVLDGTFPHVVEAEALGALDKIVNVGSCVKNDIEKHKEKITQILNEKKLCFSFFYKILESAEKLFEAQQFLTSTSETKAQEDATAIFNSLNLTKLDRVSFGRNLFLSATGQDETVDLFKENEFKFSKTICSNIFQFSKMVQILKQKILQSGNDCICFLSPQNPNFCEGLCVPSISFCLARKEEQSKNSDILFLQNQISNLQTFAKKILAKAKNLHGQLEEIYVANMNFKEVDKLTKKLVLEIENRIKKMGRP